LTGYVSKLFNINGALSDAFLMILNE